LKAYKLNNLDVQSSLVLGEFFLDPEVAGLAFPADFGPEREPGVASPADEFIALKLFGKDSQGGLHGSASESQD